MHEIPVPVTDASLDPGAHERPRLLVVDDQPINIQTIYQVFAADHQVFIATSGAQALTLCREKNPDLILLDVMMPDMDGYQVCAALKADLETRDIPVIFVTAHSDDAEETRGLDVGAVDFISKPINPKVVRARVRTHLTLKKQSDILRRMVFVDGLTGIYNRRYFDEQLRIESLRARRNASPLALMMIDVDYFKRYNDWAGHLIGDDCLRQVAAALARSLQRPADTVFRYGGEEFACLLPDTDLEGGLLVARRLENRIRELRIPHADSPIADCVTASIGLVSKGPGAPGEPTEILAAADAQLYAAKRAGRGLVLGAQMASDSA